MDFPCQQQPSYSHLQGYRLSYRKINPVKSIKLLAINHFISSALLTYKENDFGTESVCEGP